MRKAYTHHRHCCRTNFFQTALRNTFAGYHVNTQLSGRARARRWTALAIQTDYSTPAAALGRRAHSHREALSLATFLVDKVLQSHSLNGEEPLVSMRISKESSRFFSVRAVAPQNLIDKKSCERERFTMRMRAAAQCAMDVQ